MFRLPIIKFVIGMFNIINEGHRIIRLPINYQDGAVSNGNEGVRHPPQISRTGALGSN